MLRSFAGLVLDAIFPRRCGACSAPGWPFCRACLSTVTVLSPPGCRRCGRPLQVATDGCGECPPEPIAWARAPYLYRGAVRSALIKLKFSGLRSLADALAPGMAGAITDGWEGGSEGDGETPTTTWVPLAPGRRRARGYDQAEVLAGAVGELLGLPVRRLLRRVVETSPQSLRSGPDRRVALRGAFVARGRAPRRVILVDDVMTTGGTAAACAGALARAGAEEVGVLTAARSLGGWVPARCYNSPGLPPGSVVARGAYPR